MASTLPSPPQFPSRGSALAHDGDGQGSDDLEARLDALLAQYLEHLDKYARLRSELGKQFSSGFFSLAQAQRSSTLGANRRYGSEGYDERMQAVRTARVNKKSKMYDENGRKILRRTGEKTQLVAGHTFNIVETSAPADSTAEVLTSSDDANISTTKKAKSNPKSYHRDPLKWYGILTPASLRQTQSTFTASITSTVPDLLNTITNLRNLEDEIWSVRAEMGMLGEYNVEGIGFDFAKLNVESGKEEESEDDSGEASTEERNMSSDGEDEEDEEDEEEDEGEDRKKEHQQRGSSEVSNGVAQISGSKSQASGYSVLPSHSASRVLKMGS